jgi:hypothetical protein
LPVPSEFIHRSGTKKITFNQDTPFFC